MLPPSLLVLSLGWGLIDLLLRASNEGLLRPRVARAQKIIGLHPFLCSASKKGTWPLPCSLFQQPLRFWWEMGTKPIADRRGHLVKVFSPSELVIGFWQEIQPLRTFQRVIQSLALM